MVRVPGYRSGGPGFDSRALQEKKVVGLERAPLSLVSTTEELFGRNSGSGLESREYGRRDSSRWPRGTLYLQNVGPNFADKRQSLGRYSSLVDWGHGVCSWMPMFLWTAAYVLEINCELHLKAVVLCSCIVHICYFVNDQRLFLVLLGYLDVIVQEKLRCGWPGPFVEVEGCCD
jgi:hypothetical protein